MDDLKTFCCQNQETRSVAGTTLRRQTNGGAWSTVRTVEYTYYDTGDANGNPGDLKYAVTKDASGTILDREYDRYYLSGSSVGYQGGLKYRFGFASYGQLAAAYADPTTATDAQVALYADSYLEYDTAHRVTKDAEQGLGASTFAYATSTFADGFNTWRSKSVTTLPDGNTRTVYTNYAGEVRIGLSMTAWGMGGESGGAVVAGSVRRGGGCVGDYCSRPSSNIKPHSHEGITICTPASPGGPRPASPGGTRLPLPSLPGKVPKPHPAAPDRVVHPARRPSW